MEVEVVKRRENKASMYRSLVLPPRRIGNIRFARDVPNSTEQTSKVLSRPLMPRTLPKGIHEKRILHIRVHGEVEDMQLAADAELRHFPSCAAAAVVYCNFVLFLFTGDINSIRF